VLEISRPDEQVRARGFRAAVWRFTARRRTGTLDTRSRWDLVEHALMGIAPWSGGSPCRNGRVTWLSPGMIAAYARPAFAAFLRSARCGRRTVEREHGGAVTRAAVQLFTPAAVSLAHMPVSSGSTEARLRGRYRGPPVRAMLQAKVAQASLAVEVDVQRKSREPRLVTRFSTLTCATGGCWRSRSTVAFPRA